MNEKLTNQWITDALIVGISEYKLSESPAVLVTYALGSCVGICLYDPILKIGGLAHIMLPDSNMFTSREINRMKFADTAVQDLVNELNSRGSVTRRLTAKIAGGAQMFETEPGNPLGAIGARNVISVKSVLSRRGIPIVAESTGSNYGRTLYFDLSTGIMKVQSLNRKFQEL